MATGLEMFDALKEAVDGLPARSPFKINRFDEKDLCKLTEAELESRGFDEKTADEVSSEMFRTGSVKTLGERLGVKLVVTTGVRNLILGEGLRRAGGALADDPQTIEEMYQELDAIRRGGAYSVNFSFRS